MKKGNIHFFNRYAKGTIDYGKSATLLNGADRERQKKLRSLAVKRVGKTRTEVAELLAGEIHKAVEQGYSLQEIRDVLAQAGVQISLARMRNLLSEPDEKDSDSGECKVQNGINLEAYQADAFSKLGADSDEVRQGEVRL